MTVVGIGLFPDEVLRDDFDRSPRVLATSALTRKHLADVGSYLWQGLQLSPGTDLDRVIADYREVIGDDYGLIVKRSDDQVATVQRSIRPVVAGVTVFGATAVLAALALGILAGLRLGSGHSTDAATLRAIGVRPHHAVVTLAAPILAAGLLGAIGAVAFAVALSPIAPFCGVRAVEPAPGIDADVAVLGVGALVLVLVLALSALVAARSAQRPHPASATTSARVVGALTVAGARPASVVGAQQALGVTGRSAGVPARSTLVAGAVSVAAIVTALVFGASVRSLLDDAPGYGWTSDMAVSFGGGYEPVIGEGAAAVAAGPGVAGVSVGGYASLVVDQHTINAMGW